MSLACLSYRAFCLVIKEPWACRGAAVASWLDAPNQLHYLITRNQTAAAACGLKPAKRVIIV